MIKIQARIGACARTIETYLVYSMQAPGLFVPGLRECEGQGLFTFPAGLRQHAAHTFMAAACSRASEFAPNLEERPVRGAWKDLYLR